MFPQEESQGSGGGIWGGLGETLSNPMAWLGALGTGFGIYSAYNNNRRMQDAYNQQNRLAGNYNQMLQDYMSKYGEFAGQQNKMMSDYMSHIMGMAGGDIDPDRYFKAISDNEARALTRGVKANISERGIQPGGYYDSIVAEQLAKTESSRYDRAIDAAIRARQIQMQALLGGVGALRLTPPALPGQPVFPNIPQYPSFGSVDALGQALKYIQEQNAQRAARERERQRDAWWDSILRGNGRTSPIATPPRTSQPDWYNWD